MVSLACLWKLAVDFVLLLFNPPTLLLRPCKRDGRLAVVSRSKTQTLWLSHWKTVKLPFRSPLSRLFSARCSPNPFFSNWWTSPSVLRAFISFAIANELEWTKHVYPERNFRNEKKNDRRENAHYHQKAGLITDAFCLSFSVDTCSIAVLLDPEACFELLYKSVALSREESVLVLCENR